MKPAFAAMGIFIGMNSWNNFLWPMIVLNSKEKLTLPIGLNALITPYGNNYDLLIVGSVFSVIPVIILFMLFQRYFIAGMTAGGIKRLIEGGLYDNLSYTEKCSFFKALASPVRLKLYICWLKRT